MKAVEDLKANYASETDFLREQMLLILPDGDAIVKPEDIHYYKELPIVKPADYIVTIDPAFSEESTSDNTAIITLGVYKIDERIKIYVIAPIVNRKISTEQLIKEVKGILSSIDEHVITKVYVEDVATQKAIVDMLQYANIPAEGVGIGGKDKKIRLSAISPWIKNGQILFPNTGAEDLINQLLYFGTERYDDAVDALTLAVNKIIKDQNRPISSPMVINLKEPFQISAIKQRIKTRCFIFNSHISDWADEDDKLIFKRYKMRNPRRIFGS